MVQIALDDVASSICRALPALMMMRRMACWLALLSSTRSTRSECPRCFPSEIGLLFTSLEPLNLAGEAGLDWSCSACVGS